MLYVIILFAIVLVVSVAVSFGMYVRDKRQKRPTPAKNRHTAREVPSYQLNTWIDDQVAERKLYSNPDLTAADLAEELGVSERLLKHTINSTYNKTVAEYLNDRRIQGACRLLREQPEMSMEEIAAQTGFTSLSAFQKQFTLTMGQKPDHYRAQMTA